MSETPIDLQREFGEPVDHDGLDDRWERALTQLASKRKTWRGLNAHTTVVLGEGGTGKTTELKTRVAALNADGVPAFFIPIVEIVGREVRRALGIDADRLDDWLRGEQGRGSFSMVSTRESSPELRCEGCFAMWSRR